MTLTAKHVVPYVDITLGDVLPGGTVPLDKEFPLSVVPRPPLTVVGPGHLAMSIADRTSHRSP